MKITYDPEVDALSITFREATVTTKHLGEGIAADYDAEGKIREKGTQTFSVTANVPLYLRLRKKGRESLFGSAANNLERKTRPQREIEAARVKVRFEFIGGLSVATQ